MRGQFVKNWIIAWSGTRLAFFAFTIAQIFLLIAMLLTPHNDQSASSTIVFTMLSCGFLASFIEYKNKSGGKAYDYALPGGDKAEVYGMYLFVLSYIAAIMAIAAVVYAPLLYFCPEQVSVTKFVWTPVITAFGPLFILGLTMPLYYKFGRSVFSFFTAAAMIAYFIIFGGSVVFSGDGTMSWQSGVIIYGVNLSDAVYLAPALLLAVFGMYFVSMLVSAGVYKSVEH